jgi:hypothetical protein
MFYEKIGKNSTIEKRQNDERAARRERVDVQEGVGQRVLVDLEGRDLAAGDLGKEGGEGLINFLSEIAP